MTGFKVKCEGVRHVKYESAFWCVYCDRPANLTAEDRDGWTAAVCSLKKHKNRLTGSYRIIKRKPE